MERKAPETPDVSEKGGMKEGRMQTLDRRLFMQLLVFGNCLDPALAISALRSDAERHGGYHAVVYADVSDPRGIAVLLITEEPEVFVDHLRPLLLRSPFSTYEQKHELTMFGRTYSLGYEPDLRETLLDRPRRTALNPAWPWAVWYPIRRSGEFAQLPPEEQKTILSEHGLIGFSFGSADLAHDIRLASHGLDRNDSDFTVALVGKELHPLSALVQTMRRTKQTSMYLERLGPFFVGKALWQSTSPLG